MPMIINGAIHIMLLIRKPTRPYNTNDITKHSVPYKSETANNSIQFNFMNNSTFSFPINFLSNQSDANWKMEKISKQSYLSVFCEVNLEWIDIVFKA